MSADVQLKADGRRTRRHHSREFKVRAVNRCLQPGVSVAAIARELDLNANLLRQWVGAYRSSLKRSIGNGAEQLSLNGSSPSFVPVHVESVSSIKPVASATSAAKLEVNIDRGDVRIQFKVDASQMLELGQLLGEVLR